jgi:hypothetical protein
MDKLIIKDTPENLAICVNRVSIRNYITLIECDLADNVAAKLGIESSLIQVEIDNLKSLCFQK